MANLEPSKKLLFAKLALGGFFVSLLFIGWGRENDTVAADNYYFTWSCINVRGCQQNNIPASKTEGPFSKNQCIAARKRMQSAGGFRIDQYCQPRGSTGSTGSSSRPSGPSSAEYAAWNRGRSEFASVIEQSGYPRPLPPASFNPSLQGGEKPQENVTQTVEQLKSILNRADPELNVPAPAPGSAYNQLLCSAAKAKAAKAAVKSGDWEGALVTSYQSFTPAGDGSCAASGISIPEVSMPIDERNSVEIDAALAKNQAKLERIVVRAKAEKRVKRANTKRKSAEKYVENTTRLVSRLATQPETPEKPKKVAAADELLAKAMALLAKADDEVKEATTALAEVPPVDEVEPTEEGTEPANKIPEGGSQ